MTQETTFYACARFFAIQHLLDRYPNVYLMDADLHLDDDPTAFFRAVSDVPFGAPRTVTTAALSPWRRFLAGNIPLHRDALESGIVEDVQTYLAHGLRHQGAWMLDQNALAYAIERDAGRSFEPLNGYRRPFQVSRFMRTWEANFKAASRS